MEEGGLGGRGVRIGTAPADVVEGGSPGGFVGGGHGRWKVRRVEGGDEALIRGVLKVHKVPRSWLSVRRLYLHGLGLQTI